MIAIGLSLLLLAPAGVDAASFTWDGNLSSSWTAETFMPVYRNNWAPDGYPGKVGSTDTALIDVATNNPVVLSSNLSNSIATLDLDAATNDAVVSLDIQANLTVTTSTTVTGGDADTDTATITLTSATFDPGALVLRGEDPAQTRQAFFDLDGGTLTAPDSLTLQGEANIDAEIDFNMSTNAVTADVNVNDDFDTLATIDMGSNTFTAGSMTISADTMAANDAKVVLSAGTFDINGEVELNSESSANNHASQSILEVMNNVTFHPDSLDVNGGNAAGEEAELLFDESVTVKNSTSSTSFDGKSRVTLGPSTTFNAKAVTVVASTGELVVIGENALTSKFQFTSLTHNSRPMEFTGAISGGLVVEVP
jgi:hypothetical protein